MIWADSLHYFGGFSGVEVTADGAQITVVSDAGYLMQAEVIRDNQNIVDVIRGRIVSVNDADAKRFEVAFTDSEGLAVDANGQGYLSFEEHHRIMAIDMVTGVTRLLPNHPDFPKFGINAGLEALAIHPNGTLYTLPETRPNDAGDFPVYTLQRNRWSQTAHIPRRGPFLPVGADFDDDGLLYVLERAVTPLGFRSRVRRFDLSAPELNEETLLTTLPGQLDNMEALTVWRNAEGQTHVILVADDNWLTIQQTVVAEYGLVE